MLYINYNKNRLYHSKYQQKHSSHNEILLCHENKVLLPHVTVIFIKSQDIKSHMKDIPLRIKDLIKEMGISQNEFADRINTDRSNFSKQINGKLPVGRVLTNKIVVELGISKDWLLEGKGEKYILQTKSASNAVVLSTKELQSSTEDGTKVYNIDVTAGPNGRTLIFSSEQIIGTINVPFINHNSYIVKVSGDSMMPIINNGDMLAIREVQNPQLIFWGQIYIILLDDYRMVKYIRKHINPDMVILRSANPQYDDIEIPRSEIKSLFVVENIIRFDSRL
ncbi:MAG: S24 family peptidase [Bacteroidales bacterium]